MTVTADEFIRRFLQHVLPTGFQKLLVAAKPLPVATTPSCPHCGQLMTYLGFVPAPAGSVMIHDSSETKHTRSASNHGAPVLATCGKPAFRDIPHVGR